MPSLFQLKKKRDENIERFRKLGKIKENNGDSPCLFIFPNIPKQCDLPKDRLEKVPWILDFFQSIRMNFLRLFNLAVIKALSSTSE